MNWKLLALGKGFQEKIWWDAAVPESVQSCFELSNSSKWRRKPC